MITSRMITDLHPRVQKMCLCHITQCRDEGLDIIITSTFRDAEAQNALYAQGRTAPGKIVTHAKGGESWHNWRAAYDVVPLRNGKLVWGTTGDDLKLWKRVGEIGKACGLEWGGDFTTIKDMPHFQLTDGLAIADLKAGKKLPEWTS